MTRTVALFVLLFSGAPLALFVGCSAPCPAPPVVEPPKSIDSFTACETFRDLVASHAGTWGCGTELPECPWLEALDVRCDPSEVFEQLNIARYVATCAEVVPSIDGGACR